MRPFREEVMMALFFLFLSAVALLPPLLAHLGAYQGAFLFRLEQFVTAYDSLLTALGTLFLILGMGVWTTYLSNKSAAERQRADRITSAELKVAEFRQAWIDKLRKDLAEVVFLTSRDCVCEDKAAFGQRVDELKKLDALVRLRLNPNEHEAQKLVEAVRCVADGFEKFGAGIDQDYSKVVRAREELAQLSAKYLKSEWDVVRHVVMNAKENGE